MFNLEIEGKKYRLDQEWTVETWLKLHKWDATQPWQWAKMIEVACGAPSELVAQIDENVQAEAMTVITGNMVPSWATLQTSIDQHKLQDFDGLTIGQLVDLEVALGRGLESNLDWLIATLYNCDRKQVLKWNYEWAFAALQTWFVYRRNIYNEYASLFDTNEGTTEGPKDDPAYAWFDMLMALADEKFLNIHKVVDRPFREALNFLAWKKDQDKKLEIEQKKLQMMKR